MDNNKDLLYSTGNSTQCYVEAYMGGSLGEIACMSTCSVMSDSVPPLDCSSMAPFSMGFSRQEYWTGLPCPPPRDHPHPGIESASLCLLHCRWILCPVSHQESPWGRMDTCICTVEPLCCAPETITLLIGYAPI